MKNVKNFLKVFIIIVLVAAAIGGTVYFFFTHLRVKPDCYNDMQTYLTSSEKANLNANIISINKRATEMGNSNLDYLIFANDRLDMVAKDLVLYYIVNKNYDIDENAINAKLEEVKTAQTKTQHVADEFITKDIVADFPADFSAEDVLKCYANYLNEYASLLLYLNDNLSGINIDVNSDVKFSIYNLFLNVCINTFSTNNIDRMGKYVALKENDNLKAIIGEFESERLKVENSILIFNDEVGNFSKYNNLFIKYYNASNKTTLFANFAKLVGDEANGTVKPDNSNEANAAACFKILYGV